MKKSIESIWKNGFLDKETILLPKLNNLSSQKSIHIIDKFKRRFKININALIVFSFIILVISFIVKIQIMGILIFILLNIVAIINKKLLKSLKKIDKNVSSYWYLKSFDTWMQAQIAFNMKMSRYIYPYVTIALSSGFWYSSSFQKALDDLFGGYNPYIIYGIPIYWVIVTLCIVILSTIFGARIYKWDLNLVYGSTLKKLDELIKDMETLRTQ
ncbi:hypothetical protein A8C32_13605 [Flavivirga aquatica]|uniref:Uncharacterized protein n=1 Tax=Flavivirga aquatica TaxID=1849968 RepID=A0A1E5TC56_9FLAO|nr:hypothetical protein [Flavivirga aquatica]OEK08940.1 hypothetical protein A8C32_13605 [Flavivirga aquatica]